MLLVEEGHKVVDFPYIQVTSYLPTPHLLPRVSRHLSSHPSPSLPFSHTPIPLTAHDLPLTQACKGKGDGGTEGCRQRLQQTQAEGTHNCTEKLRSGVTGLSLLQGAWGAGF